MRTLFKTLGVAIVIAAIIWGAHTQSVLAQGPNRQINIPYTALTNNIPITDRAIVWFGTVDEIRNYSDVRLIYNDTAVLISAHIFDNKLWYDAHPSSPDSLDEWDAVSLYLNTDGATGTTPSTHSYRFVGQLVHDQNRSNYQAAFRGDGSGWQGYDMSFVTNSGWVGVEINSPTSDDRGWWLHFTIPFAELGIEKPATGTEWGMAIVVHDRDDEAGTLNIADSVYPETFNAQQPASWATLHFGIPTYSPGLIAKESTTTIRQGLNGQIVTDAHVGGHSTCGVDVHPNYFENWGTLNYNAYTQVSIQNQWYIGDWPCFSKYFVTFPLNEVPPGKFIISATLTMYQFGNADSTVDVSQPPEPSYIQVYTVDESWDEANVDWNNAPLALENFGGTWVDPLDEQPPWPGIAYNWDVSQAVSDAYTTGKPLRLALYSGDNGYHSGKYFSSSDVGDWNAEGRPTLKVTWGTLANVVSTIYLPIVLR